MCEWLFPDSVASRGTTSKCRGSLPVPPPLVPRSSRPQGTADSPCLLARADLETLPYGYVYLLLHGADISLTLTKQGGIVLLLAGVCLSVIQRNAGRKLSVEIGGFKRLQALSVSITAVMLLPWVAVQLAAVPSFHAIASLCAVGLAQLADFYASLIAAQRMDAAQVSRLGSLVSFSAAMAMATLFWYSYPATEHGLSVGVVIATIFFLLATATLTRPNPRSSSYSLIGYSSAGLPLYSVHRSVHLSYSSLLSLVREGLRKIMEDPNSRRIFYFLLLNLVREPLP